MIFSKFKWTHSSLLELTNPKKAYVYFRTTRMNLITGYPEVYPFKNFLNHLEEIKMQDHFQNPVVFHLYYEMGLILNGLGHTVDENTPLAIEIEYEKPRLKKIPKTRLENLKLKTLERPTWSEYRDAFNYIQEELLKGNCYQVNLTYPYEFTTEEIYDPRDLCDFFFSRKGVGAYGHATYLGDEMILSNSPECLFQFQNNEMRTMPIKGTVKIRGNWKKEWKEMLKNEKEEGELNMITDLLRNDLNRLEKPQTRVLKERMPLIVPGLLHQCSVLAVKIEEPLSLLRTLECLFPGGSITGAPKLKVMEIIQRTERYSRGFYCGSTVLCWKERKSASINIRTASLSIGDRIWKYGAGGGITLLSRAPQEFQEMESKVNSFLTLLKNPGY